MLGGFARFSGAKFSLFPAGSGLAPVVGGNEALSDLYARVISHFSRSGLAKFATDARVMVGNEYGLSSSLSLREYHSIVLSPNEVSELINYLEGELRDSVILRGTAKKLHLLGPRSFGVSLGESSMVTSRYLMIAAGRLGGHLLSEAGVPETSGKGIDFGVRLEFATRQPLAELRRRGPDAKILSGQVRTFCLNSPGRIFHYPAFGLQIPGGVVAEDNVQTSNVGILRRIPEKHRALAEFVEKAAKFGDGAGPFAFEGTDPSFALNHALRNLLPLGVAEEIEEFSEAMTASGLLGLPESFTVHYPLVDWHWPVFARPSSLETQVEGLYALGDLGGHARGLLQAAAMGWFGAEEVAR
jgi:hypothetical protein